VLVMTDGRPELMGLMGHPLPDMYVTAGVERVEVIRGPSSILHGTNALGGVVNIITQTSISPGPSFDVSAGGGSYGTYKLEGNGAYGFDRASVSASLSRYSTDGHRPYSSFDINNGAARARTALSDHFSLSGDFRFSDFHTFDPGPVTAPRVNNWMDIFRGSSGISVDHSAEGSQGSLKAYVNFGHHMLYDGFESRDQSYGVMAYEGFTMSPATTVTIGGDAKRYGGTATNDLRAIKYGTHYVSEMGTYALLRQRLYDILTVNLGVRYNAHSQYGGVWVPQAGVAADVSETTTLNISASRGFRSPSIRELYLFPAPTPSLEPEAMWNYEASILQRLAHDLRAELTGFLSEGANLIRVEGRYPNLQLLNSGSFIHRGLEVAAWADLPAGLSADAAYNYLAPGDQTMANPRHKLSAGVQWETGIWNAHADVQNVAGLYGADFSRQALPDYLLLNARVTVTLTSLISVYVAGDNLLDTTYETMTGYVMPGVTILAGVRLETR
jgi:iron complex outermembrane receptor protein